MPRDNERRTWPRVLAWAASGIMVCSEAVAGLVTPYLPRVPAQDDSRWSDLRSNLEAAENAEALDGDLRDLVRWSAANDDLESIVRQSYSMASPEQIAGLDRLWVETLTLRADTAAIESYLAIRASITVPAGGSADYYLRNWLWRTTVPAGCDG